MTEPCPCAHDIEAPLCGAKSPEGEAELRAGTLTAWGRCTRSLGHSGDHVRCAGGWEKGEVHGLERWPQSEPTPAGVD